jgi:uncharacterized membrane protein
VNEPRTEAEADARKQALERLKAQRAFRSLLATAAIVSLIAVAIWAVSGAGSFWPVWVMLGMGIAVLFSGLRAYGPGQRPITEAEIDREVDRGSQSAADHPPR